MTLKFQDSIQQQVRNHLAEQTDLAESQRRQLKSIEASVDETLTDYHAALAHINGDARLSTEGRLGDVAKLKQDMTVRLQHITDAEVKSIAKRLAELEMELAEQPLAKNEIVQFLAEQEVRTLLRDTDELLIIADYQDWSVTGADDVAMLAVENAPAAFPLISDPSILSAGKRARALRYSPEAAEALRKLRSMQTALNTLMGQAKAVLELPTDDPVARLAAGDLEAEE